MTLLAALVACSRHEGPPLDGVPEVDLLARVHSRNALAETREVRFGDASADRLLRAGWSGPETAGGEGFRWATGRESRMRLFLAAPRAVRLELRLAPPPWEGGPAQEVSVAVNGADVGRLALVPGWHAYAIEPPASAWRHGENELRFRWAWSKRPSEVLPGSSDDRELAAGFRWLRVGAGGEVREPVVRGDGLILPAFSAVDVFAKVPERGFLSIDGVDRWAAGEAAATGLRLEIDYEPAGGARRTVYSGEPPAALRIPLEGGGPARARISFRALAAEPGWLRRALRRLGGGGSGGAPARGFALRRPFLWSARAGGPRGGEAGPADAHASALAAEPAATPGAAPEAAPPNVVVYLIDTLRADHLGCYGYDRGVSPHIDRLAAEGVLFTQPFSPSSWTRASVASLFTGLYPPSHRAIGRLSRLEASHVTIAEVLRERGYETAGFVTNGNVAPGVGFAQGFDRYVALREQKTEDVHQLSDVLNEKAFEWLRAGRAKPFFLYLHATDPHAPFTPKEPWRKRFAPNADPDYGRLRKVRAVHVWGPARQREAREHVVPLYDAEIAFNDDSFGRLVAELRRLGLYDRSLIFLVSDHGEEFLDHGGWKHSHTLYQELLRVPFLVKLPDGRGAGRRIDVPVQLVDVMPTVLDYAGARVPPEVEGRSLRPLLERGEAGPDRPMLAHVEIDDRSLEAIAVNGSKLIRSRRPQRRVELFDLRADPAERSNRARDAEVDAGYLGSELDLAFGGRDVEAAPDAELDPELEERLRALGYLQ